MAIAVLLSVMEVSLSFDNAVVNAAVLRTMAPKWQFLFLRWGVIIAVVGMRLVFPIVIVALAAGLNVADVTRMALTAQPRGWPLGGFCTTGRLMPLAKKLHALDGDLYDFMCGNMA